MSSGPLPGGEGVISCDAAAAGSPGLETSERLQGHKVSSFLTSSSMSRGGGRRSTPFQRSSRDTRRDPIPATDGRNTKHICIFSFRIEFSESQCHFPLGQQQLKKNWVDGLLEKGEGALREISGGGSGVGLPSSGWPCRALDTLHPNGATVVVFILGSLRRSCEVGLGRARSRPSPLSQ